MSQRRKLLLVGIELAGMAFLESARRLDIDVHGVELPEREFGYVDHVSDFTGCRGLVDELWAEAAARAVRRGRPDGVLAFNETHVTAAALFQERLGVPGPSLHAATVSRNKALQRALFTAAEIRQPDYLVVEDVRDARDWAAERLPVVFKPPSLRGGAGVEQVSSVEALDMLVARRSGTGKQLVETELSGPEYTWDAVVVDSEVRISCVSSTETSGAPYFIELAHRTPADLPPTIRREIDATAANALATMGMRTGFVHLECRMTAEGPAVIEVAVRMPGDGMKNLLELAYGFDWCELLVRAAMGLELPAVPSAPHQYAASYLPTLTEGKVAEIKGFDDIRAHPRVVHAQLGISPGDLVPTSTSKMERGGIFLLAAPTRSQLDESLAYVKTTLQIQTTPAEAVYQPKQTSAGAAIYPLF